MNTQHNFLLINADTDAIMIGKPNGVPFSEEEKTALLLEINQKMPEKINFSDDGYFKRVVVVKAKNYVLYNDEKLTVKGSALRSSKTEPALKAFMEAIINCLIHNRTAHIINVYNEYVRDIFQLNSIAPWGSKKTITNAVLHGTRTNEKKILAALGGVNAQMGNKIYVYFTKDKQLKLVEHWENADHDEVVLLKKLYNTLAIFKHVININDYPKYTLKKNKAMLQVLLNENV